MRIKYRQAKKIYRAVKRGSISPGTAQYIIRQDIVNRSNYKNPRAQRRKP